MLSLADRDAVVRAVRAGTCCCCCCTDLLTLSPRLYAESRTSGIDEHRAGEGASTGCNQHSAEAGLRLAARRRGSTAGMKRDEAGRSESSGRSGRQKRRDEAAACGMLPCCTHAMAAEQLQHHRALVQQQQQQQPSSCCLLLLLLQEGGRAARLPRDGRSPCAQSGAAPTAVRCCAGSRPVQWLGDAIGPRPRIPALHSARAVNLALAGCCCRRCVALRPAAHALLPAACLMSVMRPRPCV
jgi:hypothetical protein